VFLELYGQGRLGVERRVVSRELSVSVYELPVTVRELLLPGWELP
jgi:hypothetical protein